MNKIENNKDMRIKKLLLLLLVAAFNVCAWGQSVSSKSYGTGDDANVFTITGSGNWTNLVGTEKYKFNQYANSTNYPDVYYPTNAGENISESNKTAVVKGTEYYNSEKNYYNEVDAYAKATSEPAHAISWQLKQNQYSVSGNTYTLTPASTWITSGTYATLNNEGTVLDNTTGLTEAASESEWTFGSSVKKSFDGGWNYKEIIFVYETAGWARWVGVQPGDAYDSNKKYFIYDNAEGAWFQPAPSDDREGDDISSYLIKTKFKNEANVFTKNGNTYTNVSGSAYDPAVTYYTGVEFVTLTDEQLKSETYTTPRDNISSVQEFYTLNGSNYVQVKANDEYVAPVDGISHYFVKNGKDYEELTLSDMKAKDYLAQEGDTYWEAVSNEITIPNSKVVLTGNDVVVDATVIKTLLSNSNITSLDLSGVTITSIDNAFALAAYNTSLTTLKLPASLSDGSAIDVNAIKVDKLSALTTLDMSASKLSVANVSTTPTYSNSTAIDVVVPAGISSANELYKYHGQKTNAVYSLSADGTTLYTYGCTNAASFANATVYKANNTETLAIVTDKTWALDGNGLLLTAFKSLENVDFKNLDLSEAGGVSAFTITNDNFENIQGSYSSRYGNVVMTITECNNLKSVELSGNKDLMSLVISRCPALEDVDLIGVENNHNAISSVNLSGNANLTTVKTTPDTKIASLDLSNCTSLTSFVSPATYTGNIKLSGCSSLSKIDVSSAEFANTSKIYVETVENSGLIIETLKSDNSITIPEPLTAASIVPSLTTPEELAYVDVITSSSGSDIDVSAYLSYTIEGDVMTVTLKQNVCGFDKEDKYWRYFTGVANTNNIKTLKFVSESTPKKLICNHVTQALMKLTTVRVLDLSDVAIDHIDSPFTDQSFSTANSNGTFVPAGDIYGQNSSVETLYTPEVVGTDDGDDVLPGAAFYKFPKLRYLYMSDGIKTLDENSIFGRSFHLSKITFPNTLEVIKTNAVSGHFDASNHNSLTDLDGKTIPYIQTLTFPQSLRVIETAAFAGTCPKDVYFLGRTAPQVARFAWGDDAYISNNAYDMDLDAKSSGIGVEVHMAQGEASRMNYLAQSGFLAMLHYPSNCTPAEAAKYTDPTRNYRRVTYDTYGDASSASEANPNVNSKDATMYFDGHYTWYQPGKETEPIVGHALATSRAALSRFGNEYAWPSASFSAEDYPNGYYGGDYTGGFYDVTKHDQYLWPSIVMAYRATVVAQNNLTWDGITSIGDRIRENLGDGESYTGDGSEYEGLHQFVFAAGDGNATSTTEWEMTKFADGKWHTICVPFNMTKKQMKETFGASSWHESSSDEIAAGNYVVYNDTKYTLEYNHIRLCKFNEVVRDEDKITLKFNEEKFTTTVNDDDIVLQAHVSYMIHAEKGRLVDGEIVPPFFKGYHVEPGAPLVTEVTATGEAGTGSYRFVGNYVMTSAATGQRVYMPKYSYFFNATAQAFRFQIGTQGKWTPYSSVVLVPAGEEDNHRYFSSNTDAGAKCATLFFGDIDETTDVNTVTIEADNELVYTNDAVYNMNGQIVGYSNEGLNPGLYIVNGKKYLVK